MFENTRSSRSSRSSRQMSTISPNPKSTSGSPSLSQSCTFRTIFTAYLRFFRKKTPFMYIFIGKYLQVSAELFTFAFALYKMNAKRYGCGISFRPIFQKDKRPLW